MANEARSIQYGSYTIVPQGGLSFEQDRSAVRIRCGVLVQSSSTAGFKSAYESAIAALTVDRDDLTITWEGGTLDTYSYTAKTALRPRASIISEQPWSNRAALLQWQWEAELPPQVARGDTDQKGYFPDGSYALRLDQTNRPEYTFRVQYRSEPGSPAKTATELLADASEGIIERVRDWLDANAIKGGTPKRDSYEITARPRQSDWSGDTAHDGDLIDVEVTARYSLIPTTASGDLSDNYTCESLVISGQRVNQWSLQGRPQPYRQTVTATVKVDHDQQQYDDINALYASEIRPWLEQHLREVLTGGQGISTGGGSAWVILDEQPAYGTSSNEVMVTLVVQRSAIPGWLTVRHSREYDDDKRNEYTKLADGQNDTYSVQSPGRKLRLMETWEGTYVSTAPLDQNTVFSVVAQAGGYWLLDRQIPRVVSTRASGDGGRVLWINDVNIARQYTYARPSTGGQSTVADGGDADVQQAALEAAL